jgi:hypothetical protein
MRAANACPGQAAISGISYDPLRDTSRAAGEAWAQMCPARSCSLAKVNIGCYNLQRGAAAQPLAAATQSLACAQGQVVSAVYAVWDQQGVQALPGVQCRSACLALRDHPPALGRAAHLSPFACSVSPCEC